MDAAILAILTAAAGDPAKPRGGVPSLTAQDVSAALSGLDRTAYWYMRVKYVDDEELKFKLVYGLSLALAGEIDYGPPLASHYLWKIAECAVEQAVSSKRCDPCRRSGFIKTAKGLKECKRCGGTGHWRPTQGEMAEYFGVSRPTYLKRIERPINLAVDYLNQLETEAVRHIKKHLFDAA